MTVTIAPPRDDTERDAIYRLRYDVYVEELGRYRTVADHEKAHLVEPEDETGRLFCATDEAGTVIAAMRLSWGGDAQFNARMTEQYGLARFLEKIPADQMVVGERFVVAPAHRGSDLIFRLFETYMRFVNGHRIQLVFGDCEPHLLNLYLGLGFRTYAPTNVNSKDAGYLVPLLLVVEDLDYLRRIDSPLADTLTDFGSDTRVPDALDQLLEQEGAVRSQRLSEAEPYARDVLAALNSLSARRPLLFDGLSDDEIDLCLAKSTVIECREGDLLIKRGNRAQNMYVALSGTLEVRDGTRVVGVIAAGDLFGEMAFLLNAPRSMDVIAATDDVKVLSLSESIVRQIMETDPACAATLLLNVSKMLCLKLLDRRH